MLLRSNLLSCSRLYQFQRKFSDLSLPEVGQSVSVKRSFSQDEVDLFSKLSHDSNPLHCDANFAQMLNFNGPIVHGALLNGFVAFWRVIFSYSFVVVSFE